jgi:hypothetical protein
VQAGRGAEFEQPRALPPGHVHGLFQLRFRGRIVGAVPKSQQFPPDSEEHRIEEVLVMTPRPGHIRAEFSVPLPRPRDRAVTTEPEFARMVRDVRAEIIDGA